MTQPNRRSTGTRGNGVSRRQFVTRGGLALGGLALGPQLLAACGGDDDEGGSGGGGGADVFFENWPEYIDTPGGRLKGAGGTLALFEQETGLTIRYSEAFNDNNEYFAKIQTPLSQGNAIGPNIIAPTNWMAGRLIELGWVEELPLDDVPNASNLIPSLRNPPTDPDGRSSLPWQAGIAGIAWNEEATGRPLATVQDLWDPSLQGRVAVLTEMRDTIGLIAMSEGIDIENPTFDSFAPAFERLQAEVDRGQIRQFTGNEYVGPLEDGSLAACFAWSGDVLGLNNPNVKFVVPDSGGTLWFDTMVVPKGASNLDAVAEWMDFVYDPENAARITESVQFISPVEGVQEVLRSMGGEAAAVADNPLVFPDAATQERLQIFGLLGEDEEQRFDEEFSRISGA